MIRTLFLLLPEGNRSKLVSQFLLTVLSVAVRAASVVLLIPLLTALFSPTPSDAWPWTGALVVCTVLGWAVDWICARIGYELGFGLLDTGQHTLADRLARTKLTWFTGENVAMARQSIAATGPELVGIMVYLVTPVISAVLLPLMIGLALLAVIPPLGLVTLAGVPLLGGAYLVSGRLGHAADHAASEANSALTERIIEFARTQHALRAARRVDPEQSLVGAALRAQHGATMRLLGMQIPGQLLFSLVSQIVLVAMAGTTVWLAIAGRIGVPEAIALIVVIVRYLEPFTVLAELSGGVEGAAGVLRRIRTVLDAPLVQLGRGSINAPRTGDGRAPRRVLLLWRRRTAGTRSPRPRLRPRHHHRNRRPLGFWQEHRLDAARGATHTDRGSCGHRRPGRGPARCRFQTFPRQRRLPAALPLRRHHPRQHRGREA